SAPGRSEVGGNHTDHQNGKVLACSLNLDVIAVVRKRDDGVITVQSEGYPLDRVDLKELDPVAGEEGTSKALIRGVAGALADAGYQVGGFDAYSTSEVLQGSGMSSSAAYEVLLGTILSGLYNNDEISPVEVAKASQVAENKYFGKPSGLLDQMACSVGNLVTIDFADAKDPKVRRVDADFGQFGHSLCITDTKGSHADLTPDYAAVPAEMKQIAAHFGKTVLQEVSETEFLSKLPELRELYGDRPVLRAIHWYEENKRVETEVAALETKDFETFLNAIKASGDSSYKYLQNVYSPRHLEAQAIPVALAVSDLVLKGRGASRVHGGGFAGTIQAFVPDDLVDDYRKAMDGLFGEGSCHILFVRPVGGYHIR
ncbi:MAG: galactokinase, partial [Clostridia bacterium]|nr:galactokinase [Clostridia bacterium]